MLLAIEVGMQYDYLFPVLVGIYMRTEIVMQAIAMLKWAKTVCFGCVSVCNFICAQNVLEQQNIRTSPPANIN